eukprot:13872288-Alexandrium_andersonii.AAC.1
MFHEQKPLALAEAEAAAQAFRMSPSDAPSHISAHVGRLGKGWAARASFQKEPTERARKCSWPGMLRAAK